MTQDECKQQYKELLEQTAKRIKEIDNKTPWTSNEPSWWMDMSDFEVIIYDKLRTLFKQDKISNLCALDVIFNEAKDI